MNGHIKYSISNFIIVNQNFQINVKIYINNIHSKNKNKKLEVTERKILFRKDSLQEDLFVQ